MLSDTLLAAYLTEFHEKGKLPSTISQVVAAVKWQMKHQLGEIFALPITNATFADIRRDGKERTRAGRWAYLVGCGKGMYTS